MPHVYCIDTPRPPVMLDTREKEEGEEAPEEDQNAIRLSELELLVSSNLVVVPSSEVLYTMLCMVYMFIIVCSTSCHLIHQ